MKEIFSIKKVFDSKKVSVWKRKKNLLPEKKSWRVILYSPVKSVATMKVTLPVTLKQEVASPLFFLSTPHVNHKSSKWKAEKIFKRQKNGVKYARGNCWNSPFRSIKVQFAISLLNMWPFTTRKRVFERF